MLGAIVLIVIGIILLVTYIYLMISIIVGNDFKEYPKETVIIKGEFGEYNVKWRLYGMAFARAIIRNKNGKIIWESGINKNNSTTLFNEASKMSKNQINKWFEYVVNEYESGLKDGGYYK